MLVFSRLAAAPVLFVWGLARIDWVASIADGFGNLLAEGFCKAIRLESF